jgi:hypothetical protein
MKRYSINEYIYFIEAWIILHVARFSILILPFKTLASILGEAQREVTKDPSFDLIATSVSHAIRRAANYTIHRSKCYDQALTGKIMLNYRKVSSTIYFGLAKDQDSGLSAHAWLCAGTLVVTGKKPMHKYTPVAWFGS